MKLLVHYTIDPNGERPIPCTDLLEYPESKSVELSLKDFAEKQDATIIEAFTVVEKHLVDTPRRKWGERVNYRDFSLKSLKV